MNQFKCPYCHTAIDITEQRLHYLICFDYIFSQAISEIHKNCKTKCTCNQKQKTLAAELKVTFKKKVISHSKLYEQVEPKSQKEEAEWIIDFQTEQICLDCGEICKNEKQLNNHRKLVHYRYIHD